MKTEGRILLALFLLVLLLHGKKQSEEIGGLTFS